MRIRVSGVNQTVYKNDPLPSEPFEVRDVDLSSTTVTDADLTVLEGLGSCAYSVLDPVEPSPTMP